MQTDEELIVAHRENGCRNSLDALLTRHLPKIRSIVFQMVLDDAIADDVTQETFLRALRFLPAYNGQAKFSTWLYRVAMNTTYTYLERRNRRQTKSIFDQDDANELAMTSAHVDRTMMDVELHGQIEKALANLSPKLRAAIVLTVFHDMSVNEAAKVEECTIATMYWRVHAARKELQRQLSKYLAP